MIKEEIREEPYSINPEQPGKKDGVQPSEEFATSSISNREISNPRSLKDKSPNRSAKKPVEAQKFVSIPL